LDSYYESEVYISHTDASKSFTDKIYQAIKKFSLGKKESLIANLVGTHKTLLDVGAGTGDFLVTAKKSGWIINGVEPNSDARILARGKGVDLIENIESLKDEKYAVITLWHVLEHLPDLESQIQKIISHLEDEGSLIIAVPNFKSKDAEYYKEFWAAYDVPRHLWHFSKSAIEKLFSKHKLHLVETRPMIFDAFYVSLLSEKYKSGKSGILILCKAFIMGLWSNISAWKTKEYSSIIYILKRG
jgi:2-polyprenyl-3-methyl-5-hydroxy-6-metoxy-1,4-benzoquinol methylase